MKRLHDSGRNGMKGGDEDESRMKDEVGERLRQFLRPEFISKRPGPNNIQLSYLAGHRAFSSANAIFNWDGWSSEIVSKETVYLEASKDGNGSNISGTWGCVAKATVRVTVTIPGRNVTYHEDVGVGEVEKCRGPGAALAKAEKEAVTDAEKRALRKFGEALGNCLYNKEYLKWIARLPKSGEVYEFDEEQLFTMPENRRRKKKKVCFGNGCQVSPDSLDVKREGDKKKDEEILEEWMMEASDGDGEF